MRDLHLTDTEARVYNMLSRYEPDDVKLSVLFRAVARRWPQPTETPRTQQQRIGPHIARLNRKIAATKKRIVPGVSRRSYRITCIL